MSRTMFRTGVAFLALVALAGPALARKPTRSPEQGTWKVNDFYEGPRKATTEGEVEQLTKMRLIVTGDKMVTKWNWGEAGQRVYLHTGRRQGFQHHRPHPHLQRREKRGWPLHLRAERRHPEGIVDPENWTTS